MGPLMSSTSNGNHDNDKDEVHPSRILLVSCPRTASNLLLTVLSLNDQNVYTNKSRGYFFYDAYMAHLKDNRAYKPAAEWSAEDKEEIQNIFQKCFDDLEEHSARAKAEGKMMFAKEHAFWIARSEIFQEHSDAMENVENGHHKTQDAAASSAFGIKIPESYGSQTFSASNKTLLSDEYLRTWKIGFIIRHPALTFASLYRAMLKMQGIGLLSDPDSFKYAVNTNMTLRWTRELYDWCEEQKAAASSKAEKRLREPVLLDANDVIHNPAAVVRFCEQTGLDGTKVQFEWGDGGSGQRLWGKEEGNKSAEKTEAQKKYEEAAKNIMLSTLLGSSGVVKEKAPETVDIAAEVEKWKEEFGEEAAATVEKAVLAAMPDYEYLKARRCV